VAERLDAILSAAAREEPTYLHFLDGLLSEEIGSKQRKRVAMGIQIAHFPAVKTLEDFDFKFQPSLDQKLVRELATGRYVSQAENVLLFGRRCGQDHLAIALGRSAVEAGHSVLFTGATALLAALSAPKARGSWGTSSASTASPSSYHRRAGVSALREAQRTLVSSLWLVATSVAACWSPPIRWSRSGAPSSAMTSSPPPILDRLLHHSHALLIQGESYRLKQKRKAGLLGSASAPARS